MSAAQNQVGHARLIAVTLGRFPARRTMLGTRLDDTSLRVAVALRLGSKMCAPQIRWSGRHKRHNAVTTTSPKELCCRPMFTHYDYWNRLR